MVKRCLFCGRYFTPDARTKERQKSCKNSECKKKRKKAAQDAWVSKNPGYFQGRYSYVKTWREKKRGMIQDEIPRAKRPQTLIFIVPAEVMSMIQDKIVMKRSGVRTFTAAGWT
jgi:hypothetical protein